MTPKPFHLFAFDHYYPSGGIDDYAGAFDTLEEAKAEGEIILTLPLKGIRTRNRKEFVSIATFAEDGSLKELMSRFNKPDGSRPTRSGIWQPSP